jgi:uncharacterized protein (TIGR02246 family)
VRYAEYITAALPRLCYKPRMNRRKFERWLEAYRQAWEHRDARAAVELYAEDATYLDTPFSQPMRGRKALLDYWQGVARTQEDIRVSCDVIAVCRDKCFAHWHASFVRLPMKLQLELDGIFVLTFDADGRCTSLREWWHRREITGRA